jgi:hypothetical protein
MAKTPVQDGSDGTVQERAGLGSPVTTQAKVYPGDAEANSVRRHSQAACTLDNRWLLRSPRRLIAVMISHSHLVEHEHKLKRHEYKLSDYTNNKQVRAIISACAMIAFILI